MPEIHQTLLCHYGVWDTDLDTSLNQRLQEILDERRRNTCFFRKHDEGMSFEAAKVLQEREAENQQLKKSHKSTQIGLWISASASVIAAFGLVWAVLKGLG